MPRKIFRKVIISNSGELTKDTRYVGETIRFRIYFPRSGRDLVITKDLVITDQLDKGLSEIKVFNKGVYEPETHTITWKITPKLLRRTYVEFEAVIGSIDIIRNQAFIEGGRNIQISTNLVEVTVMDPPEMGWIPLIDDAEPGEPPRVYMKDETTMGTTVRIDIPGVFIYTEEVDGEIFHRLSVPSRAVLTDIGKPELPLAGEIIEVPFEVDFRPELLKSETVTLERYKVYPAQPPLIDPPNDQNEFILDKPTYLKNADYPSTNVVIDDEDIAIIRGHRVLFIKFNPFQYNPVTRTVTAYPTLEVRLLFNHPAQLMAVDQRILSKDFEELLQASVLNYKDPERFFHVPLPENKELSGCDYLIITHDDFYKETDPNNPLVRFVNWKQRKGYLTKVVKVGSISGGNTPNAIKNYIQNAYTNWYPAPSYVLLVGDSDLVRAMQGSNHPRTGQPPIWTDLFYTNVDGNDYFPDINMGRLSINNLQELNDVVDKILTYEQNPPATPANADFYNHISLLALFTEVNNNGKEGRPWIANSETIRQFLLNQNYNVERIYATDTGFPANPNAQDPQQFQDGTPLPNDLISPNYGWDGDTNDISNALNNGRFLINYRAHGNPLSWDHPFFDTADIAALNQNGLFPVIFSITCQTGWFDNEIDDDTQGGRPTGDDSFTEMFLKRQNTGAVAILGMTRVSWTGYNDFLVFGFLKAIWPEFSPNPPWSGYPAVPTGNQVRLLRMGQILNFGKMFLARGYNADSTRKLEFEMGHLLGDPEMPIWTQTPKDLSVNHPTGIGATGTQEFVVDVIDRATGLVVPNANVVLTRDGGGILNKQQTHSDGKARFKLDYIGSGDLDMTVTSTGFRPYMAKIIVKSGGAVINRLEPQDGPEGQKIHVGGQGFASGENVDLYLGDQIMSTVVATGGEFGQTTPTVDIKIPLGYTHGLVNIAAHGQTSNRYAVRMFHVRDINPVDIWTYDQWDQSTWWLHNGDNPTWDSPDIQLYDKNGNAVASNNLTLGEKYVIHVNVRNKEQFAAKRANVVFKWTNYGAGGLWELLGSEEIDVPAGPQGLAVGKVDFIPQATGHLCVKAEIDHVEDTKPENNQGQENLHVGFSSSPARVCFQVYNITKKSAPVHIEVRQLIQPKQQKREKLWATWVEHPDPQILKPGEVAKACVVVDPDVADVPEGVEAEFAVTAFIGSEMVGGVNLLITKR